MGDRKPRGELAELSVQLRDLCATGKRSKEELRAAKKEVFRKVINYMTLGMDMSPLFPMVTSCANLSPDDVVLKKMLYLYLTHYATQTPDLALLTINQLLKDCKDQDPTVRGLALRSLCSLRIPNFVEYVLSPVQEGLEDRHPYVRRTAVMGVLKLHHISADALAATNMLDAVRGMVQRECDAQVVANCVQVLMQVDGVSRLASNKVLLITLLNRLKEFSDWGQCNVLEITACLRPDSEAEVYELLNALEDRLNHVNSAVVIAAVKVFLHLTLDMPATHQQVLERLREPLKTLISRDDPATSYAVLCHARLLVQRAPFVFENEYVAFYCRAHDPWYVKQVKMEILTALASSSNVYELVNELTEYARDINPAMGREAVKAVGRIALAVPDVAGIVERLLSFLESGHEHIVAEALVQLKDLLRRYPDLGQVFSVGDIRPMDVTDPEARAALIWILGQFGEHIQEAPYLLEPLLPGFAAEPPAVRLALLTASIRLFFARPPEAAKLLGGALAAGLQDRDQDVHDRALLYHRLLRYDPLVAKRVTCGAGLEAVRVFSEDTSPEAQDAIFREFNTLSVVYQQPAALFVQATAYHEEPLEPEVAAEGGAGGGGAGAAHVNGGSAAAVVDNSTSLLEGDLLGDFDDGGRAAGAAAGSGGGAESAGSGGGAPVAAAAPSGGSMFDSFLDMVGLGGGGSGGGGGGAPSGGLVLSPGAKLMPGVFQERWRSLPSGHQHSQVFNMATLAALAANGHKDFTAHMAQAAIQTMASGGQPPMYRYYFYAQGSTPGAASATQLFLVEMLVQVESRQAAVTIKSDAPEQLQEFVGIWTACLAGFCR